jgi:L-asparagine oxygenase
MLFSAEDSISRSLSAAHVPLGGADRKELLRLARHVTEDPARDPEGFCASARRASAHLPNSVAEALREFHRFGSPSGMVVISGLPADDAPATPDDNTRHLGQHTVLAQVQAIVNEFLGSMVAYEAEGGGLLFQDMVPSRAAATAQTSMGSAVELQVHTEQAFSELRPDYLSLACLRGDSRARTFVLSARKLASTCTADEVALLREPRWTTTIDASFLAGGHAFAEGLVRGPMPILYGAPDDSFLTFDQDLMEGLDEAACDLRDRVISVYLDERSGYTLRAGDIAVIDNKRVAHGRSDFRARFDGTDRFIIRSFAVRDLDRSRHAREGDSRLIMASFS